MGKNVSINPSKQRFSAGEKKNPPNSQPNAVNASENTREEKRTRDKLTLDYDHLNTLLYI